MILTCEYSSTVFLRVIYSRLNASVILERNETRLKRNEMRGGNLHSSGTVGDFYQLPPIRTKLFFENFKNNSFNLYHSWLVFIMIELNKIMRQKDDHNFIELLNRFRTGSQTEQDINCINSRSTSPLAENYPSNVLHIWAENDPVNEHNSKQLEHRATDQYPTSATKQNINMLLSKGRTGF